MIDDDPIELRRRQRERARRRNLTVAVLVGGLVFCGLVAAVIVLAGRNRGIADERLVRSDDQFVVGAMVTVEGEVTLLMASGGNEELNRRDVVMVTMKGPGYKELTCIFVPGTYDEKWRHDTRKGDLLTVTGRVDEVFERSVKLRDCKFVSQVLKK